MRDALIRACVLFAPLVVASAYRLGVANERAAPGDRPITFEALLGLHPESVYLHNLLGLMLVAAVAVVAAVRLARADR